MANLSGFVKRLRDIMRNDAGINGDAQRIEQIAWMLFLKVYDAKEQDWAWDDENYVSIIPEECRWANWAHDDRSGTAMTGERLLDFVNNTLFPTLKKLSVDASTPIKKAIVQTTFADANNYMKDGVLLRQVINEIDDLDLSDYEESHAFAEIYESILKELQSAGSAGEFYTPRAVTEFMARMIDPQIGEQMADFACGTGGFITSWLSALKKKVQTTDDEAAYSSSIYGIEKKQFPYMLCITNMLLHDLDVPQVFHDNSLLRDVLDYTEDDQFDVILMNPPYGGSEKADVKKHFPADLTSSETADLFMAVIMYRLKKNGRCAVVISDSFLSSIDDTAKVNLKKKLLAEFNLHTVIRMPGSVFAPYTDIPTNILFFNREGVTQKTWFYRVDMPDGYKHFSKTKPMLPEHFNSVVAWWDNRIEIKDPITEGHTIETWKSQCIAVETIIENGYSLSFCDYPPEEQVVLTPIEVVSSYLTKRKLLEKKLNSAIDALHNHLAIGTRTELISFGGITEQLADLDLSFPKEMRLSLLKAAVKGQMTEQLDTDEPISIPDVSENEEVPYAIPSTWKWVHLSDLSLYLQRGKSPKYSTIQKIPVIAQKCNQWSGFQLEKAQFIDPDSITGYSRDRILQDGDILINSTGLGTLGRIAIYPAKDNPYGIAVADSHVTVVRLNSELILPRYFYAFWSNPSVQFIVESQATGSTKQKELGLKTIQNYLVPVPPLAEQKRIVAKLEELLPLCER